MPFADIEFEFPTLFAVAAEAPQLKGADFGHSGVKVDGDGLAGFRVTFQSRRKGAEFFNLALPFLDHGADGVVAAYGGSEKAELGGSADDQAEFLLGQVSLGAFLHAEGDHAKSLERWWAAGNGG